MVLRFLLPSDFLPLSVSPPMPLLQDKSAAGQVHYKQGALHLSVHRALPEERHPRSDLALLETGARGVHWCEHSCPCHCCCPHASGSSSAVWRTWLSHGEQWWWAGWSFSWPSGNMVGEVSKEQALEGGTCSLQPLALRSPCSCSPQSPAIAGQQWPWPPPCLQASCGLQQWFQQEAGSSLHAPAFCPAPWYPPITPGAPCSEQLCIALHPALVQYGSIHE